MRALPGGAGLKSYNIALIPGDGTGPEVLAEGVKVLNAACAKHGIKLNYQSFDFRRRALQSAPARFLPDSALEEFKKFDSIFWAPSAIRRQARHLGSRHSAQTRFALDQYINLRPVKLYPNVETPLKDKGPEHIDFVVVRENRRYLHRRRRRHAKGNAACVATQVMQYSPQWLESRGEPPSSARRVPSREGMEPSQGFHPDIA